MRGRPGTCDQMVCSEMTSNHNDEKENGLKMKMKLYVICVVKVLMCSSCTVVCVSRVCIFLLLTCADLFWILNVKIAKVGRMSVSVLLCENRIPMEICKKLCKIRRTLLSVYSCYLLEGVRLILRFLWCGLYRVVR